MIEKVYFQDIDLDGACLGYVGGKKVRAFGVLPGETAKVKVVKKRREFLEVVPVEILDSSPYRVNPIEEHFISCSPWQVMDYNYQLFLKKKILENIFGREDIILEPSPEIFGYRTKMEFSFFIDDEINLAFFKRGTYKSKYKLNSGCILGSHKMNEFALKITESINRRLTDYSVFKGLMVRESKANDCLIASLFVKSKEFDLEIDLEENRGLGIFYSDPNSPAFVFTDKLEYQGIERIMENINGLRIFYGSKSFFQNNVYLLQKAISDMKFEMGYVRKIVELYCGVGTIGLALSNLAKEIIGIELIDEACYFAKINTEVNNIKNYIVLNGDVRDIDTEFFKNIDALIVDPPRNGLNNEVIKKIIDCSPHMIVYLSCNPLTQKRDCELLKDKYMIKFIKGYDFYPNTPHIESLMILIRK
ncbi:MAG: methyltransferase [bacterium]|nr:methyltransferase [bacterium]